MPCFTVSRYSVELTNRNPKLLASALEAMGFSVRLTGDRIEFSGQHNETGQYHSGSYVNGRLSYTGEISVDKIKQHYAVSVLKNKAQKFGWKLKQTGPFNYAVQKG